MSNPKPTKATLKSVADCAGVSPAAVSFVLNGRDQELRIAPETKEKILQAARQLNYTPNYFARSLNGKATRTIGVLWSFSGPHRDDNVIRHLTRRALAANYITHLFDSLSDVQIIERVLLELANRKVDGIIIQVLDFSILEVKKIRELLEGFRASVVVGQGQVLVWRDQVMTDRAGAFSRVVDHYVASGRQRLGLVTSLGPAREGYQSEASGSGKVASIQNRWIELGRSRSSFRTIVPADVVGDRAERISAAVNEIDWRGGSAPDALICSSDEYAFIVISSLRKLGLRVPEDVAVVGANDSEMAPYFTPPLASIKRCADEAADKAMEFLFNRLKNPELPPQNATIDIPFILRDSAG